MSFASGTNGYLGFQKLESLGYRPRSIMYASLYSGIGLRLYIKTSEALEMHHVNFPVMPVLWKLFAFAAPSFSSI